MENKLTGNAYTNRFLSLVSVIEASGLVETEDKDLFLDENECLAGWNLVADSDYALYLGVREGQFECYIQAVEDPYDLNETVIESDSEIIPVIQELLKKAGL